MSVLFRLTLIVIAFCVTSVSVIHVLATRQSATSLEIFTNPDGSPCKYPCLFGVQPGQTSLNSAVELLHAHHFTSQVALNLATIDFRQGSTQVIIPWTPGDSTVWSIELVIPSHPTWGSLGQVIAVLGPPERVRVVAEYSFSFWFAGQLEFIHTRLHKGYLSPNDPLERIVVQPKIGFWKSAEAPWQGFSSVERYSLPTVSQYGLH